MRRSEVYVEGLSPFPKLLPYNGVGLMSMEIMRILEEYGKGKWVIKILNTYGIDGRGG